MARHGLAVLVALVAAVFLVDLPAPCLAFFSPSSSSSSSRGSRSSSTGSTPFSARLVKQMSSLTTAVAAAAAAGPSPGIDTSTSSEETTKRRAIVVVGLNGALQRTIVFKPPKGLHVGHVNRASSVGAGIGGKGQNVCVALRKLVEGGGDAEVAAQREEGAVDVTLAHFAGGKSGESVCEKLFAMGVKLITSTTEAEMRLCTSLVDERFGETTEIIEPWSAEITEDEQHVLVAECKSTFREIPGIHGVAVMGSSPAGVGKEILMDIMGAITESGGFKGGETRVLVDSIVGFQALVDTGHISLLKVNAEELVSLAESGREGGEVEDGGGVSVWMEDKLAMAAEELFVRHGDRLPWIAVTNGGLPSYLFSREFLRESGSLASLWRLTPAPVDAINPIGAGDAVAAATLYEWTRGVELPEAFRRALSIGGASCTSRDPICNSSFSMEEANRLLPDVRLQQVERDEK
ncbi:unnamed protein product [Pylaiella littoralis]